MKRVFTVTLMCVLSFMVFISQAQRVVTIPPTTDFNDPSDIYQVIMNDIEVGGERVDNNTVYKLVNGGFYITSSKLINTADWPLVIEAEDLTDTDNKPVITTVPNASGNYPFIAAPEGDFILRNIWVIEGERGPLEGHAWGSVGISGENATVILEDCLMEKDMGGFLQLLANGLKVYVNNCVFRNGGARRIISGNGRGIDARNYAIDSLVVTNSIFYNIHDRIFRSQGATEMHNYIKFDHNTIFNHFGRHGCFQFAQAKEIVVTNNLISNPIMQGTTPIFADEQTQVDNESHKVFTIDKDSGTKFEFSNNNIFWTQDVLDYWASNDSVSAPAVYSEEILAALGGETAAAATYFSEQLELNSVPVSILQLVKDTYADPTSTDMFDIIVEDISRAGTTYDDGNLFDFSTFDAGYDGSSQSASGDSEGNSVGAISIEKVGVSKIENETYQLNAYPNPTTGNITFGYTLESAGNVRLSVFDIQGKEHLVLVNEVQSEGSKQISVDMKSQLNAGFYLIKLQTESGATFVKKVILK